MKINGMEYGGQITAVAEMHMELDVASTADLYVGLPVEIEDGSVTYLSRCISGITGNRVVVDGTKTETDELREAIEMLLNGVTDDE